MLKPNESSFCKWEGQVSNGQYLKRTEGTLLFNPVAWDKSLNFSGLRPCSISYSNSIRDRFLVSGHHRSVLAGDIIIQGGHDRSKSVNQPCGADGDPGKMAKTMGFGAKQISVLCLTSAFMTLGKLFNISMPWSLHLKERK